MSKESDIVKIIQLHSLARFYARNAMITTVLSLMSASLIVFWAAPVSKTMPA